MSPAAPTCDAERAALITQLVCSAIQMDYAARRLQAGRAFSQNAKRRLNLLVAASDSFVEAATVAFGFEDADATNTLSTVLAEHAALLLRCRPSQIEDVLNRLLAYVRENEDAHPIS